MLRRPLLIQPHLDRIVLSSLAYMRFDPNYSYGDENNDGIGDGDEIDEDAEDFEGDE